VIWSEPLRYDAASSLFCRPHPERNQARRPPGGTGEQARTSRQHKVGAGARADDPASNPGPRRRGHRVKRWASCWLAIAISAAASFSATAQQPAKVFRIGILSPAAAASTKGFEAFRKGLRELGYIEGWNIEIEYRLAAWDYGRLPAMAADLVRLPV